MSANRRRQKHSPAPSPERPGLREWFTPFRFAFLLGALTFVTFPGVVLGLSCFVFRDFGLFAYPVAYFQRQCFWQGELPFWNPYNNCGVPLLAQWNTMALYPPALFYLVLPLSWALSYFSLAHLLFGGLGMYFLARKHTGDHLAAALAGVSFSFCGVAQNFLMWPSHSATFGWMPWVVLTVTEACRSGGRRIPLAALAGAFQMLAGGPETIFFTWCFVVAIVVIGLPGFSGSKLKPLLRLSLVGLLVLGISSAQLIPFFDLAAHSQRERHFSDLRSAMPARGWANLLVPLAFGNTWEAGVFKQHGQSWTSSYYTGIGPLLLALFAVWKTRSRLIWLLAGTSLAALILALGEKTIFYTWLQKALPLFRLMAFPVKFVIVTAFTIPLLAALGLARFRQSGLSGSKRELRMAAATLTALLIAALLWQWGAPLPGDNVKAAMVNGAMRAGFLVATWVLVAGLTRGAAQQRLHWLGVILLLATWLDLRLQVPRQNPTANPSVYTPDMVRKELAMQPEPRLGESRVMLSPAADAAFDSIPVPDAQTGYLARRLGYFSDCNLLDAVPKVNGFFSLYPYESYQISLLMYLSTNTSYPRLADFLSVSHITAPGEYTSWQKRESFLPMVTAGQKPVFLDDTNTVAALTSPEFDGGRTVFLPLECQSTISVRTNSDAHAKVREFTKRRIEISAEGSVPFLVVISQTYYHRWRAYVDGTRTPVLRANYAFQAVELPPGKHDLRLVYEAAGFTVGAWISGAVLLGVLVAAWRLRGT